MLTAATAPGAAYGQSLIEMYRAARFQAQTQKILEGYRPEALPAVQLRHPTDTLQAWMDRVFPREPEPVIEMKPPFEITRWRSIPKLGRPWFQKEFGDTRWTYIGSNEVTTLDTTFTRELRARLEAEFGSPTQTIPDRAGIDKDEPDEYVQFEYWFVVNDSIPLLVMDTNGPFERGLVVATDHAYAGRLSEIKEAFLAPLLQGTEKARYVDYYFLPEQQMWFRAGYDGNRYFVERIRRPDLKLGRPLLKRAAD